MSNSHKYSCIPDKPDQRDMIHPKKKALQILPKRVDLRPGMGEVFSQGELGSCTANAIVGLREYLCAMAVNFSRLYVYYKERELEGTIDEDSGAMIRDGMKVLHKFGVCPERYFPYDASKFTNKPTERAEENAGDWKISSYQRITSIDEARLAISKRSPVVFGFPVYESFETDRVAKTGIMVMPKDDERLYGGHAVLAVGYDDAKKWLIVRNSWGREWGDKGHFYMPYAVFSKHFSDAWTGNAPCSAETKERL